LSIATFGFVTKQTIYILEYQDSLKGSTVITSVSYNQQKGRAMGLGHFYLIGSCPIACTLET
jgi:hypothetical protein